MLNSTPSVHFRPRFPHLENPLDLHKTLQEFAPQADWVGLRLHQEITHWRGIRKQRPESNSILMERGLMVEVMMNGHIAYAGTSDLSPDGLKNAFERARSLAIAMKSAGLAPFSLAQRPKAQGNYASPKQKTLDQVSLSELTDILLESSRRLKVSDKIVNDHAFAMIVDVETQYVTSSGTDVSQSYLLIGQDYRATAVDGAESQSRSWGHSYRQVGLETFNREDIFGACEALGREALELLTALECPSDTRDVLLSPDQMAMQIHESIGHPLELDRILGDERNYAGWSFVKPTDFGKLRYGSKLMNVTFDPSVPGEYASYMFDDCGNKADRQFLIQDGVLQRGLGSLESQARLGLPGVANFRSASWNRAPIDRMANINLEPGASELQDMIAATEKGIYMQTNRSWSIDDYRNKFQFGCEYAQLIENGQLTKTVKNPNYRGATIPFWNSLKAVGHTRDVDFYGSPYCGKGEPSQVIRVGHSSPPCLFKYVQVFGGGK